MAERTAIITASDVSARLSTQAYARLFAQNGGNTPVSAFVDLCVAEANSVFRTLTRPAFPDGVYTDSDTIDPAIVGAVVDLCCEIAACRHGSYDPDGAYGVRGRAARELIRAMNRDADARPPGSSTAPARPRASITNTVDADGVPTNPYTRAADGGSGSGF